MIRLEDVPVLPASPATTPRLAANPLRGEFDLLLGGERCRFNTRLSTVAAIEAACGERPIVDVLSEVVTGRRARDVLALVEAALAVAEPPHPAPARLAAEVSVGEAESFVLALLGALGFSLGAGGARSPDRTAGGDDPFAGPSRGATGGPSRSAPCDGARPTSGPVPGAG